MCVKKSYSSITANNNNIVTLNSHSNKLSNSFIPTLENNREVVFENLNLSDNTINNSSNNFLNYLSSQFITDINLPAKSISEIKAISTKK